MGTALACCQPALARLLRLAQRPIRCRALLRARKSSTGLRAGCGCRPAAAGTAAPLHRLKLPTERLLLPCLPSLLAQAARCCCTKQAR